MEVRKDGLVALRMIADRHCRMHWQLCKPILRLQAAQSMLVVNRSAAMTPLPPDRKVSCRHLVTDKL